ncbi:hypothetical protein CF160_08965 [Enterococcus pseudoavium]|nr:hypothetical protein CF160_08965 [Enterococcus pseudoavium]
MVNIKNLLSEVVIEVVSFKKSEGIFEEVFLEQGVFGNKREDKILSPLLFCFQRMYENFTKFGALSAYFSLY